MQQSVHVDAFAKRTGDVLSLGATLDFLGREVNALRVFPMQQRGSNPDFVSHLKFGLSRYECHHRR